MKKIFKELVVTAIISILFLFLFAIAYFYATSPKIWFANQHDSKCEQAWGEDNCKCYERLNHEAK